MRCDETKLFTSLYQDFSLADIGGGGGGGGIWGGIPFQSYREVPWVPEVFFACSGNFRCWLKADTSSAVGRIHERRAYWI